ncbi:10001_t:CDS:2, partial [Ambispora gerdemannii]
NTSRRPLGRRISERWKMTEYLATATWAASLWEASMFMTATWAVNKLSLLSSRELHGGHLGGDSLAFPFIPVHFTLRKYLNYALDGSQIKE